MYMLLTLAGRKGSGKSSVAKYLAEKHKFKILSVKAALKQNTQRGFYLVDGVAERTCHVDSLIAKGSALWLVRKPGEPYTFRGRKIAIVVENSSTLNEIRTAVEQKLWGCC